MANLSPNPSLLNLASTPKLKNRWGTIGNNTKASYNPEEQFAVVSLHSHPIATLNYGKDDDDYFAAVVISDCGYGTVATRDRINQVLAANKIPFYMTQKNHVQVLYSRPDHEKVSWTETPVYGYGSVTHIAAFVKLTATSEWELR